MASTKGEKCERERERARQGGTTTRNGHSKMPIKIISRPRCPAGRIVYAQGGSLGDSTVLANGGAMITMWVCVFKYEQHVPLGSNNELNSSISWPGNRTSNALHLSSCHHSLSLSVSLSLCLLLYLSLSPVLMQIIYTPVSEPCLVVNSWLNNPLVFGLVFSSLVSGQPHNGPSYASPAPHRVVRLISLRLKPNTADKVLALAAWLLQATINSFAVYLIPFTLHSKYARPADEAANCRWSFATDCWH